MQKSFRKFIPFAKVAEQSDGSLHVYGLVTAERPDQEDEVCDYDSTKPFYQKLVTRYTKATAAVDGMEQSIAPLREMHQLKAVGCGKSIDFDDSAKTIHMGFKVVEAEACKKVKAGVLIGFSQGGDYIKTWKKGTNTWYTADPGEVSLVDSPCLEDALIETLVEKSFEYVKENGSTELRKFHVEPRTEDPKEKEFKAKIAELTKRIEELKMKPELVKKFEGKEPVTLTAEEQNEVAELLKAHTPILDHLHQMHKAVSEHMHEMHDHIAKCHKALGHEPMKSTDTGDVKKTFTKEELDAQIAKALEDAKAKPEVLAKADVEKLIADAVEKATKEIVDKGNDPTRKAKLMLIGRDGKEITKTASDVATNDQTFEKSVGF